MLKRVNKDEDEFHEIKRRKKEINKQDDLMTQMKSDEINNMQIDREAKQPKRENLNLNLVKIKANVSLAQQQLKQTNRN
mgnify:CR=1 FL=1